MQDLEKYFYESVKSIKKSDKGEVIYFWLNPKDKENVSLIANKGNDQGNFEKKSNHGSSGLVGPAKKNMKKVEGSGGSGGDLMKNFKSVISKFESKLKTIHTKLKVVGMGESQEHHK
jgi:hypothetical protein